MQLFDDLIRSYVAADLAPETVQAWYRQHSPSDEALSTLAENIGAMFIAGQINFTAANGLLNQLMSLSGFEQAPQRFWQYYIAFEDYENSANPDSDARPGVAALTSNSALG